MIHAGSMMKCFLFFLFLLVTGVLSQEGSNCTLSCYNHGVCKPGKAKFGFSSQLQDQDPLPFASQSHNMHCSCPTGYTGLQCEIKFVVCGKNQHTCFNGAKCTKEDNDEGVPFYHCECDAAKSDVSKAYAGYFCQHAATVFCSTNNTSTHSFCTNGGRCSQIVNASQPHHNCECPGEWEGPHCEFVKGVSYGSRYKRDNPSPAAVFGFSAFALTCATVLIGLVVAVRYRRRFQGQAEQELTPSLQLNGSDDSINQDDCFVPRGLDGETFTSTTSSRSGTFHPDPRMELGLI